MPTCHKLFACFDMQQEAVGKFRFGLYCNRRLSVNLGYCMVGVVVWGFSLLLVH